MKCATRARASIKVTNWRSHGVKLHYNFELNSLVVTPPAAQKDEVASVLSDTRVSPPEDLAA